MLRKLGGKWDIIPCLPVPLMVCTVLVFHSRMSLVRKRESACTNSWVGSTRAEKPGAVQVHDTSFRTLRPLLHSTNSSLGGDMLNNDALKGADASKLVEELLEDTDIAKFFDEEFEVRASVGLP